MKKNFKMAVAAMIVAVAGIGTYVSKTSEESMSNIAMANVDALANTETTPCKNAAHCTQMDNNTCWYYVINADNNMMVSSFNNQIHRGQD